MPNNRIKPNGINELTLYVGEQTYVYRFRESQRKDVERLVEQRACEPNSPFDALGTSKLLGLLREARNLPEVS